MVFVNDVLKLIEVCKAAILVTAGMYMYCTLLFLTLPPPPPPPPSPPPSSHLSSLSPLSSISVLVPLFTGHLVLHQPIRILHTLMQCFSLL